MAKPKDDSKDTKKDEKDAKKQAKKTMWERFVEKVQWLAIILGWIRFSPQQMQQAQNGPPGSPVQIGEKQFPSWVLSIIARVSKEDEEWENVIVHSTNKDAEWQDKYFQFRDYIKGKGKDLTQMRLMLIRMFRNKEETARNIISQIVQFHGDQNRQMRIAEQNYLLYDVTFLIELGTLAHKHKLVANILFLPVLILVIVNIFCVAYWGLWLVYMVLKLIFSMMS